LASKLDKGRSPAPVLLQRIFRRLDFILAACLLARRFGFRLGLFWERFFDPLRPREILCGEFVQASKRHVPEEIEREWVGVQRRWWREELDAQGAHACHVTFEDGVDGFEPDGELLELAHRLDH
jgi:hypothetical protein